MVLAPAPSPVENHHGTLVVLTRLLAWLFLLFLLFLVTLQWYAAYYDPVGIEVLNLAASFSSSFGPTDYGLHWIKDADPAKPSVTAQMSVVRCVITANDPTLVNKVGLRYTKAGVGDLWAHFFSNDCPA